MTEVIVNNPPAAPTRPRRPRRPKKGSPKKNAPRRPPAARPPRWQPETNPARGKHPEANSIIDRQVREDPLIAAFALQLANPFATSGVPYPGEVANDVAIYRMERNVDVPFSSDGRFAMCLQPKLGNPNNLAEWQLYQTRSDAPGWSGGSWNDAANYVVNSTAGDLRVDPNYQSIIVSQPARRSYNVANPGVTIPNITTATYNDWDENQYGLSIVANATGFVLTIPSMPPTAAVLTFIFRTNTVANTAAVAPTVTLTELTRTTVINSTLATSTAGSQLNVWTEVMDIETNGAEATITVAFAATALNPTINGIYIEMRPQVANSVDNGLWTSVQPVAAAIHLQWVGPTIENAGSVACALGAVNSTASQWLADKQTNCAFRPQFWDTYTQLPSGKDSRTYPQGQLKHGAFVSWRPQRPEDRELFKPSVHNATGYAPLYVAGQYNTTGAIPAGGFLRAMVTIVFQYETPNRLLNTTSIPRVYSNAITVVENFLTVLRVPIAGPNGFHEWWTNLIEKAGAFFSDIGGVLGVFWQKFLEGARPKLGYKSGPFEIGL